MAVAPIEVSHQVNLAERLIQGCAEDVTCRSVTQRAKVVIERPIGDFAAGCAGDSPQDIGVGPVVSNGVADNRDLNVGMLDHKFQSDILKQLDTLLDTVQPAGPDKAESLRD